MEELLISILSSFSIFICFSIFYRIRQKEEKKYKEETEFMLKQTKGFTIFFCIWICLCFIGVVIIVILNFFAVGINFPKIKFEILSGNGAAFNFCKIYSK